MSAIVKVEIFINGSVLNGEFFLFPFFFWNRLDLDQIRNIGWHFFDGSVVKLFKFSQGSNIVARDKIDGNSLSTESPASSESVNVVFQISW